MRPSSVLLALACACSAPANLPDLAAAERMADAGDLPGALAAFHRAQVSCRALKPERRARAACADALLGEPDALDHAGKQPEAIAAYEALPARADGDPTVAATGLYRAGDLLIRDPAQTATAWTVLWRVVTDYPDEPLAADALRDLLLDGRKRDPRALATQIEKLQTPLAGTAVGDNLAWSLADLDEHELGNLPAARALYDRIPIDYPQSGLRDDARWRGAQVSIAMHDATGAITRLRGLLATREVSWFVGSYFSIWLDDAQLLLGQLLRDEQHDLPAAAAAFRKLPKDYPASTLRDDALFELSVTLALAHDDAGACRAIADLDKLEPDSKYVPRAAAMAKDIPCPR